MPLSDLPPLTDAERRILRPHMYEGSEYDYGKPKPSSDTAAVLANLFLMALALVFGLACLYGLVKFVQWAWYA